MPDAVLTPAPNYESGTVNKKGPAQQASPFKQHQVGRDIAVGYQTAELPRFVFNLVSLLALVTGILAAANRIPFPTTASGNRLTTEQHPRRQGQEDQRYDKKSYEEGAHINLRNHQA